MALVDWLVLIGTLIIFLLIGVYFRKTAQKDLAGFFLGGRNLPWYIAGLSMVATTFAADTPLAVTELVAESGISGNWLWWNMLIGGVLTTFFFARLWRRSGVLTELEFINIRYGGKSAQWLRGFKAIYIGLFMNALIIAWVNIALASILTVFFNISENEILIYVFGAMLFATIYSAIAGLKGIAVTDAIQFIIAMTGSIILAVLVIQSEQIGGIAGLKAKLPKETFNFFPNIGNFTNQNTIGMLSISIGTFLAYSVFQWWASWYPGAEPGGGGYIAQRMMSAKNESHSFWATLFFQTAHYALRPWPWILVGLASIVLYPDLAADQKRIGYVLAMKDFLPTGLKGLLLVAFLSAYFSTISTQLNFGSSLITNDFFKIVFKNKFQKHKQLVWIGRIATIILMLIALYTTTLVESITSVWKFILECGAGLGLVLILRWYWWRINVWSEITATITPFFVFGFLKLKEYWLLKPIYEKYNNGIPENILQSFYQTHNYLSFPFKYFIIIAVTTVIWIIVTLLTKPEKHAVLSKFCDKVKPAGIWTKQFNYIPNNKSIPNLLASWILAIIMIYSLLFGIGKFILHEWADAIIYGISFLVCLVIIVKLIKIYQQKYV